MPSLYQRETRAVTLASLQPALSEPLAAWARRQGLALDAVTVWCTHSVNPPGQALVARLLGRRANTVDPDASHDTALVLLATHLIVATYGARRGASVLGLALRDATVTRGRATVGAFGAAEPDDDGISITGFAGDEAGRPASYFFGLGGAEADACFAAVARAVRESQA
ncbi:MAG: hypothetical protein Q8Q09_22370 [Deltaproteobacteria bacterium]|nr:hypothetical protein [Deltaproteobacteria bacterium]